VPAVNQPRDEDGRFASGGGGAASGVNVKSWAKHLVGQAEKSGGFTVRPKDGGPSVIAKQWEAAVHVPHDGIMVSRDPKEGLGHVVEVRKMAEAIAKRDPAPTEAEARKELAGQVRTEVEKWLKTSLPAIGKLGPDHFLGGWHEKDDKGAVALHLDVSQRFDPGKRQEAASAGKSRNQMAVWDIGKKEEIPTGGTGR
jgi:hypothetical protein